MQPITQKIYGEIQDSSQLTEYLETVFSDILKERYGIGYTPDLYYSLSYSQGDGVSLSDKSQRLDAEDICKILKLNKRPFEALEVYADPTQKRESPFCHYYHEKCFYMELDNHNEPETKRQQEILDSLPDYQETITDIFYDICKEVEKQGYNFIDELEREDEYNQAFQAYINQDNPEYTPCLYNYNYTNTQTDGFTLVYNPGVEHNTPPLYVKL